MFISRISLNVSRRETRKLLGNPQAMHAKVMGSFPPVAYEIPTQGRILWRVDSTPTRKDLLIVSPTPPDLTGFVEDAGWPSLETWQTREYAQRLDSLCLGQQWAFRLTANPTHWVRLGPDQPAKRLAHVTAAQQLSWLEQKSGVSGFRLLPSLDNNDEHHDHVSAPAAQVSNSVEWKFKRKQGIVTVKSAQFDGLLEVTDVAALKGALINGIGPAKAYGCGLLTLAPLPKQ